LRFDKVTAMSLVAPFLGYYEFGSTVLGTLYTVRTNKDSDSQSHIDRRGSRRMKALKLESKLRFR